MPRTTKELNELEEKNKVKKAKKVASKTTKTKSSANATKKSTSPKDEKVLDTTKKKTTKKVATAKTSDTKAKKATTKKDEKKATVKTSTIKKVSSKKAENLAESKKKASKKDEKVLEPTKKKTTKKVATPKTSDAKSKKATTKKNEKKSTTKTTTKKKSTTLKADVKKASTSSKRSSKSIKTEIIEYYDLPYRYDKTIVKILAQTPKKLFVYWDISDKDRKNFLDTYGENFFEITKPVLIIRNLTMNYSFEVDINDFANSWYLNINDSDCKYSIELGRRPIHYNSNINTDYIYVSSSNDIQSPNDRILFENAQNMVYYRNIRTNVMTARNITSLSFITNMGRIYNIYDLYKKIYADEELEEFNNPSSSFMK